MFDFFKRKHNGRVVLLNREPFKLTLSEFRSDKNMAAMAEKVLGNQNFRLMIQVLYNSSPAWEVMTAARADERIVQQARIEGYTMALANLESMSKHEPMRQPLEATWEPEEEQADIQQR